MANVLVCDDEELILEMTTDFLEIDGHQVYACEDGESGLERYQQMKDEIDLVLIDMIMPGIDGVELFSKLSEVNPSVKVILSSGFPANDQIRELLDNGLSGFLQKPYRKQELSDEVKRVLTS